METGWRDSAVVDGGEGRRRFVEDTPTTRAGARRGGRADHRADKTARGGERDKEECACARPASVFILVYNRILHDIDTVDGARGVPLQ